MTVVSTTLKEELISQPLEICGHIPDWLSGSLIRNGPIYVTVDGRTISHWFDGLAMLHAFSFNQGEVRYTNKFLRTDAYDQVFKKGSLNYKGFAMDPCRLIFKRLFTLFSSNKEIHNANINVTSIANQYIALTELPLPVKFDIQTLNTLGVLDYEDSLPHDKCWESAHPHYDAASKEMLNYLIEYGLSSTYTLYRIKDGSAKREIISKIPVKEPAYMHSFAVTDNYVVFAEFPFVVKPLDLISQKQAFIKNFSWQPNRGTRFIVVNRHQGNVIGNYYTKPFFAFHHVNAFETNNHICLDIVTYEDPEVITQLADYFRGHEKKAAAQLERFDLSLTTGSIHSETPVSSLY